MVGVLRDLFGLEDIWVSDASQVGDFRLSAGDLAALEARLGVRVASDDLIVNVASRLRTEN